MKTTTLRATTRSAMLLLSLIPAAWPQVPGKAAPKGEWIAYVGTYTRPPSKGIYAWRFDPATGKLTALGVAAETSNPSFLAVHPNQRFLYAANENDQGMVSAFAIDPATGHLKLLSHVSSRGSGPCHVSVDGTGKWVMAANYNSGSVASFPVRGDGSLGEAASSDQHSGSSVNPQRQRGPHAHSVNWSPDNRFVAALDLGLDQILVYRVDPASGSLTPNDPPFANVAPGSGPRHMAFGKDGHFAYVLSEMLATVTAFRYDSDRGSFAEVQTISMLPEGFTGVKSGAEIAVDPSGRFLYASNRGHDSIALFRIDAAGGKLAADGHFPTQGKTPRNFAIDPTGAWLFAANQDSGGVVVFRIDHSTGRLTPSGNVLDAAFPVCVVFASAR